jgi:16S rRNA (uracil1498-N3)-methyltransferase
MHAFYLPDLNQDSKEYTLTGKEFNHFKVLRIGEDEKILLSNGYGLQAICKTRNIGNKSAELEILSYDFKEKTKYQIDLAFGLIKDKSRLEFLIEKVSEFGINNIIPLTTEYSQKKSINTDKLRSRIISAFKQSNGFWISSLSEILNFDKINELAKNYDKIYFADKNGDDFVQEENDFNKILLLIGSEGGFSESEIKIIKELPNIKSIRLSNNILRTETACISIVSKVMKND